MDDDELLAFLQAFIDECTEQEHGPAREDWIYNGEGEIGVYRAGSWDDVEYIAKAFIPKWRAQHAPRRED